MGYSSASSTDRLEPGWLLRGRVGARFPAGLVFRPCLAQRCGPKGPAEPTPGELEPRLRDYGFVPMPLIGLNVYLRFLHHVVCITTDLAAGRV